MHGSVLIHPPLVAGPAIFLHPFKSTQNVPLTSRARGVHQAYAWRPAGCSDEFRRYKPVSETLLDLKSRTENLLGFAWVPLRKFRSSSGRFPGQPQFVRKAYVVNGRKTALIVNSDIRRLAIKPIWLDFKSRPEHQAKPANSRFDAPYSASAMSDFKSHLLRFETRPRSAEVSANPITGNTRNSGDSGKTRAQQVFTKVS